MDMSAQKFADRADAGRILARLLVDMELDDPLIYALPRGGVPVAVEVAKRLGAPLDLLLVRKIGAPQNPEVALGALVEGAGEEVVINEDVKRASGADDAYIARAIARQKAELDRRRAVYLGDREHIDPKGRTAIVVDDGLATGATMKAALIGLKRAGPARIVVALPVAPKPALQEIYDQADDILCIHPVTAFRGVGAVYRDFHQLTDEETVRLLDEVRSGLRPKRQQGEKRQVAIPPLGLPGDLTVPANPKGIVVFAHGSGSSRLSPRNAYVAEKLNAQGFATLLFDLLTPEEGADRRNVFDIPLLADRIVAATIWVTSEPDLADLPLGLFGASTGAAAALVAAAELGTRIDAVVSRGGRPDMAMALLPHVKSPTLLIVGGRDTDVLKLNQQALAALSGPKLLKIVPDAGHLFEEPGTLDAVIDEAAIWFKTHLSQHAVTFPEIPPISKPATNRSILRDAAEPLPAINDPDFAKAFDRFGKKRLVLLGEASHGTSEFYSARAAITRRLIEEHGFSIVAVEADWPDAAAVDRYVRQRPHDAIQESNFARFPTWMWRNVEFETFTRFLRHHNGQKDMAERVAFYGLDLYNMHTAIAAVLAYLDRVDPSAAAIARDRYACLIPWAKEPASYGRAALTHGFSICEDKVVQILSRLLEKQLAYVTKDGEQFFDATQNARLVANAERYYRVMYYGSQLSWNLRDQHMFKTLQQILDHAGPDKKAVVWAHNSHIGDARHTDMGRTRGELNIGQLSREKYGDDAALIGFGTGSGTVAAASEWDDPVEIKTIRPPLAGSYENLCQSVEHERFLWDFTKPQTEAFNRLIARPRLERYIGVIYRPETERASHYSYAELSAQYDAFVWFDRTNALTPLSAPHAAAEDETYPFGL